MSSQSNQDALGPTLGDAAGGVDPGTVAAFDLATQEASRMIAACTDAIALADTAKAILEAHVEMMQAVVALIKSKAAML